MTRLASRQFGPACRRSRATAGYTRHARNLSFGGAGFQPVDYETGRKPAGRCITNCRLVALLRKLSGGYKASLYYKAHAL